MIIFGPIMAVFCIGILCLIMDCIYPEIDEDIIYHQPKQLVKPSSIISDYLESEDQDFNYNWDDK